MKIYYERSGGFMGRSVTTVIDTDSIPPEEALKLVEIIDELDFFELSSTLAEGPESMNMVPDEMCYRVTVEIAGVRHSIETSDTTTPNALQQLINELDHLARQAR